MERLPAGQKKADRSIDHPAIQLRRERHQQRSKPWQWMIVIMS